VLTAAAAATIGVVKEREGGRVRRSGSSDHRTSLTDLFGAWIAKYCVLVSERLDQTTHWRVRKPSPTRMAACLALCDEERVPGVERFTMDAN